MHMMFRTNYRAWLIPYLEGTLDQQRKARLEQRLRIDPALADEAEMLRLVIGAVRSAAVSEPAPTPVWSIWPRVELAIRRYPFLRNVLSPLPAVGAVSALLVALLVVTNPRPHAPDRAPGTTGLRIARSVPGLPAVGPLAGLALGPDAVRGRLLPGLGDPLLVRADGPARMSPGLHAPVMLVAENRPVAASTLGALQEVLRTVLLPAQTLTSAPAAGMGANDRIADRRIVAVAPPARGGVHLPIVAAAGPPPPPPATIDVASVPGATPASDVDVNGALVGPSYSDTAIGSFDPVVPAPEGDLSGSKAVFGGRRTGDRMLVPAAAGSAVDIDRWSTEAAADWERGAASSTPTADVGEWEQSLMYVEGHPEQFSPLQAEAAETAVLGSARAAGGLMPLRAVLEYDRENEQDPANLLRDWRLLGLLYRFAEENALAVDAWRHVTLADASTGGRVAEDWYQLGLARAADGDVGGATSAYTQALPAIPDPTASPHWQHAAQWLQVHAR
jgi:hypothetical protein